MKALTRIVLALLFAAMALAMMGATGSIGGGQ
jgi:hypothetical protein